MLSRSRLLLRRGACAFRASAPLRSASETGGNGGEPTTPTDRDLIALLKPREALFDTSKKRRRTFYETVYKIPHFAEGKRVTRKLWLMQGHQNTYVVGARKTSVLKSQRVVNHCSLPASAVRVFFSNRLDAAEGSLRYTRRKGGQ